MTRTELLFNVQAKDNNSIVIKISAESEIEGNLFSIDEEEANQYGEAQNQILEGHSYEYNISGPYKFEQISGLVSHSKYHKSSGRITPNTKVGTLSLKILSTIDDSDKGILKLEVRSIKASYRSDYRLMLEEITEKCTDLLMQHSSHVSQMFAPDHEEDSKTWYQKFAFIKSILDTEEFTDAVNKIIQSPVTKWMSYEIEKDICNVRKINNKTIRQIAGATSRIPLPANHPLRATLGTIPSKIKSYDKKETVDTVENRFVKYALQQFLSFVNSYGNKLAENVHLVAETQLMEGKLELILSHSIFHEISKPDILPLNSPVLQRKEGYRELLRIWLMFELASKLVWHGGDDVYDAGKRDVAVLYEYWLFFKLLDIVGDIFKIEPQSIENLIEPTADGLGLKLKQGRYLPLKGLFNASSRKLNVEFSYNRTFKGNSSYPNQGSWTTSLRPDYTLTVWPYGIGQAQAEKEELIVHVHFDAKYKVEKLIYIIDEEDEELDDANAFKRNDLLKMHTYKDAIRRSAGAYILYPGTDSKQKFGFHEILPGLGAFSVRPSKEDNGLAELKDFLNKVLKHYLNRASQREKISLKTYETYKDKESNQLEEYLPETYGDNRDLIPDETYVLVAYYKGQEQLNWIIKSNLYNARMGSGNSSLRLNLKATSAKYLLLHTGGEKTTGRIFKIKEKGPRVFSKDNIIDRGYPNPSQDFYLVYDTEVITNNDFQNMKWDVTKLPGYKTGRQATDPFAVSMTELMQTLVK